jgi:hypothetical protein
MAALHAAAPIQRDAAIDQVLDRIQGEFLDLPGLCLTTAQARRLWNLDADTCEAVLHHLVDTGFLDRDASRQYVRHTAPDLQMADIRIATGKRRARRA